MNWAERNAGNLMNKLGLFFVVLLVARAASGLVASWKTKTPSIVLAEWC